MNKTEVIEFLKTCNYANIVTEDGTKTTINCRYLRIYSKRYTKMITENPKRILWRSASPTTLDDWINGKKYNFYAYANHLFKYKPQADD